MTYDKSFLGSLCPPQNKMEEIRKKKSFFVSYFLSASCITDRGIISFFIAHRKHTNNILSLKCVFSGIEFLMMSLSGVIRVRSPT